MTRQIANASKHLATLESLEAIARGSVEPSDGWTAHYTREEAARTLVQMDYANRSVRALMPETTESEADFAAFWAGK